ncbi:MAG: hypothetical protein M3Y41_01925, partial [Pseudomonadota bacterium]|nr:hypothetical protein [Pseudomonadota bacterium]
YYLLCAWPAEYPDDAQSRFINERAHANIQKDGTYSVVPRMWGGVTSATGSEPISRCHVALPLSIGTERHLTTNISALLCPSPDLSRGLTRASTTSGARKSWMPGPSPRLSGRIFVCVSARH